MLKFTRDFCKILEKYMWRNCLFAKIFITIIGAKILFCVFAACYKSPFSRSFTNPFPNHLFIAAQYGVRHPYCKIFTNVIPKLLKLGKLLKLHRLKRPKIVQKKHFEPKNERFKTPYLEFIFWFQIS